MVSPERGESVGRRPGTRPAKSAAAFRTISEVADELDVAQHVLRFWESKFPQVRPLKRGGGRRYYRPEDVDLLRQIRSLLYEEGYTIRGAQKLLKGQRRATVDSENGETGRSTLAESQGGVSSGAGLSEAGEAAPQLPLERTDASGDVRERLMGLRAELVALRRALRDVIG